MNTINKDVVLQLHAVIGGDPKTEEMVLEFIQAKFKARSLFHLPPAVAKAILKRPRDFIKAVKEYCLPDVPF